MAACCWCRSSRWQPIPAAGNRASFTTAAAPELAQKLFEQLLTQAQRLHAPVGSGIFGADMQVALVNDGPVTFWLEA